MKFRLKVREGESFSIWYGHSYRDYLSSSHICYLVPFHLPIRWARNFWIWFIMPMRPDFLTKIYDLGFQNGYEMGMKNGLELNKQFLEFLENIRKLK